MGLEQDVIIRAAPPPPAQWGLSLDTTYLEIITEFIEAPEPTVERRIMHSESNPLVRQTMAEPDLFDEFLDFGSLKMGAGSAFRLQDEDLFEGELIPVAKTWQITADQRRILVEKVAYRAIERELQGLPQAALTPGSPKTPGKQGLTLMARHLPPTPPRREGNDGDFQFQVAAAPPPASGLVLDYTLNNATNFTFKGDTTYYISANVTLSGTNIIEGGAVLKFTNSGFSTPQLIFAGEIDCRTTPYRPAVLTGEDDDSVGSVISGSTGSPSGYYSRRAFALQKGSPTYRLHDIHIRYSKEAIHMSSGAGLELSDAQIGYGDRAVGYGPIAMRNVLIHDQVTGFFASTTLDCQQVTFHKITSLLTGGGTLCLTNSLVISVTNSVTFTGSNVETNLSDTGMFLTVGEGGHYLAAGSAYRNAGTTNITNGLLAHLQNLTTYPPLVLTNTIAVDTVWNPQAQRDADGSPDLGFHYYPIDVLVSGLTLTNATLLITNGTTIGIDFNRANYGLRLHSGARLISEGSPNNMNRFVRLHGVQEMRGTSGSNGVPTLVDYYPAVTAPELHLRFTDLPMMAGNYYHLLEPNNDGNFSRFTLRDSEIRGGKFYLSSRYTGTNDSLGWTNNLLDRVVTQFRPYPPMSIHLWNNSFVGGSLNIAGTPPFFTIKDNIFDQTALYTNDAANIVADYNVCLR